MLLGATKPADLVIPSARIFDPSQTQILDRQGELIQTIRSNFSQFRGQWVDLDAISPAMITLVTFAEDQRFWQHAGVDWLALGNATKHNIGKFLGASFNTGTPAQIGNNLRGASTITMQLAGVLQGDRALGQRRTIVDKIQQMRSAWQLESAYSKQQILAAYLNTVTFRGEIQGIDSASAAMFAKAPIGLQTNEAALLVTLVSAPQARIARIAQRACRLIEASSKQSASNPPLERCDPDMLPTTRLARPRAGSIYTANDIAPHAGRIVMAEQKYSQSKQLKSTLDARSQRIAVTALSEQMRELARQRVEDGAVVVLDNLSGDVIAYVASSGGFSGASEVDAARSPRQAGSTLKPFLYAQAIEQKRITAASLIDDSELAIRTNDAQYLPRNYSEDFKGWVSVRKALAGSLNIPAVRTLAMLEVDDFVETLRKAGLTTLVNEGGFYGHSLALGSADVKLLDLTNAYRTLANGGVYSGVQFSKPPSDIPLAQSVRVFSEPVVAIVTDIMADNDARSVSFGLDSALRLPFRAAVKTGTSKDMRDNWCIGFTERYTVGVWVGNASGVAMRGVSGVSGAAPIWRSVMLDLHANLGPLKGKNSKQIAGLIKQTVRFNGVQEAQREELFLAGTQMANVDLNFQAKSAISRPLHGAVYAIDPDIPKVRQTIWFEAQGNEQERHWLLNGERINNQLGTKVTKPTSGNSVRWPLTPGKHQLRLVDQNNVVIDQVYFEVKAPARVLAKQ